MVPCEGKLQYAEQKKKYFRGVKEEKRRQEAYANFVAEKREIGMVLWGSSYLVALLSCWNHICTSWDIEASLLPAILVPVLPTTANKLHSNVMLKPYILAYSLCGCSLQSFTHSNYLFLSPLRYLSLLLLEFNWTTGRALAGSLQHTQHMNYAVLVEPWQIHTVIWEYKWYASGSWIITAALWHRFGSRHRIVLHDPISGDSKQSCDYVVRCFICQGDTRWNW